MFEEIIERALESILGWQSELSIAIVDWIKENLLAPNVVNNAKTGISIYNGMLGNTLNLLTTNPMEWNSEGWQLIAEEVYPAFLMIACPLVVIFYLIEFCNDTSDMRMNGNNRVDRVVPGIFKLSLAEFVTVNALWIICLLFSFVDFLTGGWIGENSELSSELGFTAQEVAALSGLVLLVTYIVSFVYMVALIVIACVILHTATIRFFKILTLIPVGSLASSTIAGSREISSTAMHFWKYMIGVVLEAVLMIVVLALFSKIQNSLCIVSLEGELRIIGILLNRLLISFLCLGSIKGVSSWIQRAVGL
ncbi:MAG: hypothetical protein J6J42_04020 [Lachnospiraceae bacterium]|nr:hypothetical protein [Lachnospiraceae bacterium]